MQMRWRLSAATLAIAFLSSTALLGRSVRSQRFFTPQDQSPPPQTPPDKPVLNAHPVSRSPLRLTLPRREYLCAGGTRILIRIETKAVSLTVNGHTYNLQETAGGSGSTGETKYAAGSLIWSSTGDDGFLVDNADPEHPKMLAEQCHLQGSAPPTASGAGSIKGTAIFASKSTLPSDAILIVQLKDLAKDADDPAAVLAEERLPVSRSKSPVSFTLRYDSAKFVAKNPCALSASITGRGGKLLFVLVKPLTIADVGNPGPVALTLSRATSAAKTPPVPEAPPHL